MEDQQAKDLRDPIERLNSRLQRQIDANLRRNRIATLAEGIRLCTRKLSRVSLPEQSRPYYEKQRERWTKTRDKLISQQKETLDAS